MCRVDPNKSWETRPFLAPALLCARKIGALKGATCTSGCYSIGAEIPPQSQPEGNALMAHTQQRDLFCAFLPSQERVPPWGASPSPGAGQPPSLPLGTGSRCRLEVYSGGYLPELGVPTLPHCKVMGSTQTAPAGTPGVNMDFLLDHPRLLAGCVTCSTLGTPGLHLTDCLNLRCLRKQ